MNHGKCLGMAACQATAILPMIQVVVHLKTWLQSAAKWWTFLGASCCLACHPQMGERTGSLDKSPAVWKKEFHRFRRFACLILIFNTDMSVFAWCGVFFCDRFTADRRRRLAYPFLGIIDIYICLGTRIGIWFILYIRTVLILYMYIDVCDATLVNCLVSFVAGVAAFVLVK